MAGRHHTAKATVHNGQNNDFVFSDDLSDWLPKPRKISENTRKDIDRSKVWRNTTGFRRANNGMKP